MVLVGVQASLQVRTLWVTQMFALFYLTKSFVDLPKDLSRNNNETVEISGFFYRIKLRVVVNLRKDEHAL